MVIEAGQLGRVLHEEVRQTEAGAILEIPIDHQEAIFEGLQCGARMPTNIVVQQALVVLEPIQFVQGIGQFLGHIGIPDLPHLRGPHTVLQGALDEGYRSLELAAQIQGLVVQPLMLFDALVEICVGKAVPSHPRKVLAPTAVDPSLLLLRPVDVLPRSLIRHQNARRSR